MTLLKRYTVYGKKSILRTTPQEFEIWKKERREHTERFMNGLLMFELVPIMIWAVVRWCS